jgi:hypothetical protein
LFENTLFYANSKNSSIQSNEEMVNASYIYAWENLTVTRSVQVSKNSSTIAISYKIDSETNLCIEKMEIKVWPSYSTQIDDYSIKNTVVSLNQRTAMSQVETTLILTSSGMEFDNLTFTNKDSKYSLPVLTYSLMPQQSHSSFTLQITAKASTSQTITKFTPYSNSLDLIKNLKVDYILLNKLRINECSLFANDLENFTPVFENTNIIVLRVNAGGYSK